MEIFRIWFYNNFDWLYTKIHENPLFFIDYWSLTHLWVGFIVFVLLLIIISKKQLKFLFLILVVYEIFEIVLRLILFKIIEPETFKDQITDIAIGMLGGLLAIYLIRMAVHLGREKCEQYIQTFTIIFASLTISFLWVGFYGYKYSADYLNTPGLNLTTFLIWSFGIIYIIYVSRLVYNKTKKKILSLFIIYLMYLPTLFLFEYFNYHILKVHEISTPERKALIFDIVHGTTSLHVFYLSVPIISIIIYYLFVSIFRDAVEKEKNPELRVHNSGASSEK